MPNLLVEPRVSIDDVLINTRVKGLDLVPSNIDLSAAEIQLVNEVGREQTLSRALYPVLDRYDYVLIDCQPSLGLLTVNGLACADGVIIPTECEFFSLRGLALLTDTVDKVRDRLNPKLDISGILITRYYNRTVNAREVMSRVVQRFPNNGSRIASDAIWCSTPSSAAPCASRRPASPVNRSPPGPRNPVAPRRTGRWRARSSTGSARDCRGRQRWW